MSMPFLLWVSEFKDHNDMHSRLVRECCARFSLMQKLDTAKDEVDVIEHCHQLLRNNIETWMAQSEAEVAYLERVRFKILHVIKIVCEEV